MTATKLVLGFALAIALGLGFVSTAHAQGPDVQIVQLECNSDPERVVIENLGDADQDFTDWQLLSDPAEVFNLSGGLVRDTSITIQSGPSASGAFTWGLGEFIFRDDDLTDYVRIVDDTGAIVHQANCAPEPSLTPTAPSPAPTPEPSPAEVPNGGGPPPLPGNALSPAIMVLIGGSMAAAGIASVARPWLRLRHLLRRAAPSPQQELAAARPQAQRGGANGFRGALFSVGLGLALMGITAAIVVELILKRR